MRKLVIAAAVLFAASAAEAADTNGDAVQFGIGTKTCADYLAADETARAEFKAWSEGYISAANRVTDGVANLLGTATVDQAVLMAMGFCDAQRDWTWERSLYKALDELVDASGQR